MEMQLAYGSKLTLIFAIATLHFLMCSLLDLPFQDACSRRLIKPRCLENMSCIYPVIGSTAHDTVALDFEFIHWDLPGVSYTGTIAIRWKYDCLRYYR